MTQEDSVRSTETVRLLDIEYLVDDASVSGTTAYYVRGHMEPGEFIAYLDSEYGVSANPQFVRHTYMGFSPPCGEDGWRKAWFRDAPAR